MALTIEQKKEIAAKFQGHISSLLEATSLSKADIKAWVSYAVGAIESGLVTINNNSPDPAKSSLTLEQKRWIFKAIIDVIFKEVS